MKEATFKCFKCNHEVQRFIERGKILEPDMCDSCKAKDSFQLIHNACYFSDKQHVKVQETPESVPEGETPQTIHLCAYEDLVDYVRPGDRVEITGIYKAMGVRLNSYSRTLKNVYRTYIDVICYKKDNERSYANKKETSEDDQANEDAEMADMGQPEEQE